MNGDTIPPAIAEGFLWLRRRQIFALGAMLCAPVILAFTSSISPELFSYLALVTLGLMIFPIDYWFFSTCPRCKQLFCCSRYWIGLPSKCVNCDVPLDGPVSDE